jgi:hypothetical protein
MVWGIVALVGAMVVASDVCAADVWHYGLGYHYPYLLPRTRLADQHLPYFAAHPPVYYSHIVSRPYGYSPYAYLPGVVTPDFELNSPWHPGQPFRPYWDGKGWKWRPRESDKPAPKRAPQATRMASQPRPVTIQNEYYRGSAGGGPDGDPVVATPMRITNPYVVKRVDLTGG